MPSFSTQIDANTSGHFSRLLRYLTPYKWLFIPAVIGMVGYSSVDTFVMAQLQPLIDDSLNNSNHHFLRLAAYAIVPLFILRGIFNFMGTYTVNWIGSKVVMQMRQQLFEKYIHLPVEFHDRHPVGELISKLTYDTEQVANACSKAMLIVVREGAFILGLLIVMFYYSWQLSLVFLIIAPLVGIIVSLVSKRFRKVSKHIQQAMGSLTTAVEQTVKGHKVVLMFGGQRLEKQAFKKRNNHNRQQTMKLNVTQILSVSSIQVIASFALAAALYMASTPAMVEQLTVGVFINVILCMTMLLRPLKQLTKVNNELQKGLAACASVFDVLDEESEQDTGLVNKDRVQGDITFSEVSFTYPSAQDTALKQLSFTAQKGEKIALVGKSGSGKSTISSLLTRFYRPQSGVIAIDGVDINTFTLQNLRQHIALVSQHVTLFNDTIANNIAYAAHDKVTLDNITRDEIERVARQAHVLEFSNGFEKGLDTVIGENGSALSGGQRQRIAIARALLLNAPILILDEATSALDTESEKLIQDALQVLTENCTSIIIAHRLSTIEHADKILVIDKGEIIEQGTHGALLEQKGAYAQLHAMQFGD